jgi:hypothetical protein
VLQKTSPSHICACMFGHISCGIRGLSTPYCTYCFILAITCNRIICYITDYGKWQEHHSIDVIINKIVIDGPCQAHQCTDFAIPEQTMGGHAHIKSNHRSHTNKTQRF